ncbi:MAG: helix-turn-helix transcriptional regulator [Clostridia bacterium]|nr:helix-turn-helix transcriptional regulator [Clostridia bacterium]
MKTISKKIKALRLSKRLTQNGLAEALSVSVQTVSKWENGVSLN